MKSIGTFLGFPVVVSDKLLPEGPTEIFLADEWTEEETLADGTPVRVTRNLRTGTKTISMKVDLVPPSAQGWMPLSPKAIEAIVYELPESQRSNASKRITDADRLGWTQIGIWTWIITRRHEADLVGVNPRGKFDFLWWDGCPKQIR